MNGVDYIIDGRQAVFFSDVCDMGISYSRVGGLHGREGPGCDEGLSLFQGGVWQSCDKGNGWILF